MGSFSDNEDKNKFSPDFPAFEKVDSSSPAPAKPNASDDPADKFGVTYPGADFENAKSNSKDSNDFEYGDDSVAGEYEVKESSVFKYGTVASSEAINAYYGNGTHKDNQKENFEED